MQITKRGLQQLIEQFLFEEVRTISKVGGIKVGEPVQIGARTIPPNAAIFCVGVVSKKAEMGAADSRIIVKRSSSTQFKFQSRQDPSFKLVKKSDLKDFDLIEKIGGVKLDYEKLADEGKLAMVRVSKHGFTGGATEIGSEDYGRIREDLMIALFDTINLAMIPLSPVTGGAAEAAVGVLDLTSSVTYYKRKEYLKSFLYLCGIIPFVGEFAKRLDEFYGALANSATAIAASPKLKTMALKSCHQLAKYLQTSNPDSVYNDLVSRLKKMGVKISNADMKQMKDIIDEGYPEVVEIVDGFINRYSSS